jgi:hypothetical protein
MSLSIPDLAPSFSALSLSHDHSELFSGSKSWADICAELDPHFYDDIPSSPKAPHPTPVIASTIPLTASIEDGFTLVSNKNTNNSSKTIVLRNLPRDINAKELRSIFERYGPIHNIYIPTDKSTGHIKGFCFIEFIASDSAAAAYASLYAKLTIRNRCISIELKKNN